MLETRKRSRWVASGMALAALLAACAERAQTRAIVRAPSVAVTSPAAGTTVGGNVVDLAVEAKDIEIVKADGDTSGRTGHYHVFVDRDPVAPGKVIPREPGVVHATESPIRIAGLPVGEHRFVVVLGDGTHRRIGDRRAEVAVKLLGPSVDASAPASIGPGQAVTVTIMVQGVALAAADPSAPPGTGHLHVLVDAGLPPAGRSIPKGPGIIHTTQTSVVLPGLAAGEHTIWVVLGDGRHVPFAPLVADKVVVTVG